MEELYSRRVLNKDVPQGISNGESKTLNGTYRWLQRCDHNEFRGTEIAVRALILGRKIKRPTKPHTLMLLPTYLM
ncbi:unnamed protein product, partial [Ilex paraguariensis]